MQFSEFIGCQCFFFERFFGSFMKNSIEFEHCCLGIFKGILQPEKTANNKEFEKKMNKSVCVMQISHDLCYSNLCNASKRTMHLNVPEAIFHQLYSNESAHQEIGYIRYHEVCLIVYFPLTSPPLSRCQLRASTLVKSCL